MKLLVFALLALPLFATDYQKAYEEIHGNGEYTHQEIEESKTLLKKVQPELQNLERLAVLSNTAIRSMVKIATTNLRKKGYVRKARQINREWKRLDGTLIKIARGERNIGDFEPLSNWLAVTYEAIEMKLGFENCQLLRLTDMKTFNFGLRVVFRPCLYGNDEFYLHFVRDYKYKGVAPVAAYWAVSLSCSIATYSVGWFFICSPIGILVENGVMYKLAPWAAPKVYAKACPV